MIRSWMLRLAVVAAFVIGAGASIALEPGIQLPIATGGHAVQALRPANSTFGQLDYATSSVSTSAIAAHVVRVVCSADCRIIIGDATTAITAASNTGMFLPADVVEYFRIVSGTDAIVAIQDVSGSAGVLYYIGMK